MRGRVTPAGRTLSQQGFRDSVNVGIDPRYGPACSASLSSRTATIKMPLKCRHVCQGYVIRQRTRHSARACHVTVLGAGARDVAIHTV